MAPRAPPKRKKTKKRVFLVIGDPNGLPKKFSAIFGAGCRKVCCCSLNGAIYRISLKELAFVYIRQNILWSMKYENI